MKDLKEYQEDIYKCSKCGLCQSVCPIYKATKNESILSRGKFTILNGIINNELKFTKNVAQNLEMCLNCNLCKNFCPSGIDAKEIFASAKNEYSKKHKPFIPKHIIEHTFLMYLIKIFGICYRFFNVDFFVKRLENNLIKSPLGRKILLADFLFQNKSKRKQQPPEATKYNIVFFEGCFNRFINPSSKNSSLNLLEQAGCKILNIKQRCCGISYYYYGNHEKFKQNAIKITALIPEDCDYIVFDCDSCISMFSKIIEYSNCKEKLKQKLISLNDFLVKTGYKKDMPQSKVLYHKPCHNEDKEISFLSEIDELDIEKTESCCGFSGDFGFLHNEISTEISKKNLEKYNKEKYSQIISSCPSCIIGLKQGSLENKKNLAVKQLSEFLDE